MCVDTDIDGFGSLVNFELSPCGTQCKQLDESHMLVSSQHTVPSVDWIFTDEESDSGISPGNMPCAIGEHCMLVSLVGSTCEVTVHSENSTPIV